MKVKTWPIVFSTTRVKIVRLGPFMDDLVLNLATDDDQRIAGKSTADRKGGRWTDRRVVLFLHPRLHS